MCLLVSVKIQTVGQKTNKINQKGRKTTYMRFKKSQLIYEAVIPPSIMWVEPVMNWLSSLARNTAREATSSLVA